MTPITRRSPLTVWAVLCVLSVLSVLQLEEKWLSWSASVLVTVIAGVKSRLVIVHYMEVSRARAKWRALYGAWTFATATVIIAGYLLSRR